jgi:hypothetical protein
MITGVRPFGEHETSTKMLAALLSRTAKPLTQFAETPLELDRIIRRCLGRKPQQRYATIDDLALDLDALLAIEAVEKRTEIMLAQEDIITPLTGDEDVAITPQSDIEDVLITPPTSMADVPALFDDSLDGKTVFAPPPIVLDDEPEVTVRKPKFIETRTLPGIIAPKKK